MYGFSKTEDDFVDWSCASKTVCVSVAAVRKCSQFSISVFLAGGRRYDLSEFNSTRDALESRTY
jgi:hypothetical protein